MSTAGNTVQNSVTYLPICRSGVPSSSGSAV